MLAQDIITKGLTARLKSMSIRLTRIGSAQQFSMNRRRRKNKSQQIHSIRIKMKTLQQFDGNVVFRLVFFCLSLDQYLSWWYEMWYESIELIDKRCLVLFISTIFMQLRSILTAACSTQYGVCIGNLHIFVYAFRKQQFFFCTRAPLAWFLDLRLCRNYLNWLNYIAVEYWIEFQTPFELNIIPFGRWQFHFIGAKQHRLVYFFLFRLNYFRFPNNAYTHRERETHSL